MVKNRIKEETFDISDRVMITDASDTVRGDLVRALIEFITNSDDSYKRLEAKNAKINGNIDIEYDRKLDTAILKVRDYAEGLSHEDIIKKVKSYAKQTSGFNESQGSRSVRGLWGRGLRQGLIGLGSGEIHSVKDGKYNGCEIYVKNQRPRIQRFDEVPANKKVRDNLLIKKKNGTVVSADCSNIKIIPQYEGLKERLQNHFEIRHIINDPTRQINFISKRGKKIKDNKVLKFEYPKAKEIFNEEIDIENYPKIKAKLKLSKCDDELTTISDDKESSLSGIVFYTQGLAVDNTAFDYAADEAFSYFFGSCDCSHIRELALKNEPIFSTNRTGPVWSHHFMNSLKNSVLKKIKPFIDAKRREIQSNRQSTLDKKYKAKIDDSVNKLNDLFKKLLGDIDGGSGPKGDINKPDPSGGFGFLSDYYSIISNKPNRISIYAKKSIASEGDIVNFSTEEKNINILTDKVALTETKWDDLLVATARVEGGQVGADTIFYASYDSFEAQTLLHSVAKQTKTEEPTPKKKKGGGFINDIKWDNTAGIKQRVMFDATNNVVIYTKSPSVALYIDETGKGFDTPSGSVMIAELVTEAVCKAVAKKAIETGRHVPLINNPDAINVFANQLQNQYADIIHKMYVDIKYMSNDKKVIDLKSRAEKEEARVNEI